MKVLILIIMEVCFMSFSLGSSPVLNPHQLMFSQEGLICFIIWSEAPLNDSALMNHCLIQDSLGTLLMALSGRRTLTVRMAVRLMFCRSREYSTTLNTQTHIKNTLFKHLTQHRWCFIHWFFGGVCSRASESPAEAPQTHTAGVMISGIWSELNIFTYSTWKHRAGVR